jgi:hypothetical protein
MMKKEDRKDKFKAPELISNHFTLSLRVVILSVLMKGHCHIYTILVRKNNGGNLQV